MILSLDVLGDCFSDDVLFVNLVLFGLRINVVITVLLVSFHSLSLLILLNSSALFILNFM